MRVVFQPTKPRTLQRRLRASVARPTTGLGSKRTSRERGWARVTQEKKAQSLKVGLGMLFYFFAKRGWDGCSNFKINRDAALTEWRSLIA